MPLAQMTSRPKASLSPIRVRLTAALALALLPVLVLGCLQSAIAFHREDVSLKVNLGASAQRSAASARARLEGDDVLLHTLAPGSVGFQSAQRLAQVPSRIPGYANLIRFDRNGKVACAAGGVPSDPQRAAQPWFRALEAGDGLVVVRNAGQAYAGEPSVLAAVPAIGSRGEFEGAFAAIIALSSLQPSANDPVLPSYSEVALADFEGRLINATNPQAFGHLPADWRSLVKQNGSVVWYAIGQDGPRP